MTELKQPDITVYGVQRGTWHASADKGTVQGEQEIYLQGNVHLRQRGKEKLDLRTERLRIDTARHYAETDALVRITAHSSRLQGVGMKAYGEQQRILLQSAVRGQYAVD
jgi:lipopolysaccharide export system protein LptC